MQRYHIQYLIHGNKLSARAHLPDVSRKGSGNIMCNCRNGLAHLNVTDKMFWPWVICSPLIVVVGREIAGALSGRKRAIEIVECSWDGTTRVLRRGREAKPATPMAKRITYVKLMVRTTVPLGAKPRLGGSARKSLATRLVASRKELTIVGQTPISFVLAHKFSTSGELPCIVSTLRKFVFDDRSTTTAIAVDVGGPGFLVPESSMSRPATRGGFRSRVGHRAGRIDDEH